MKLIPWMVVLSVSLVGCSGSKSAQPVSQETPQVELSDADEFIENPNEELSAEPSTDEPIVAEEPASVESSEAAPSDDFAPEAVADADQLSSPDPMSAGPAAPEVKMDEPPYASSNIGSGSEKTYKVQKNETLMMVAFKLYGDYSKWKQLANYNRDALGGSTVLREGMNLKYMAPAEEFVWNPQGLPYLIRTGDTLGRISSSVYQTPKKWKLIWDNNRPLIKDPNKIFAGFTLYYLESGRDVASEIQ